METKRSKATVAVVRYDGTYNSFTHALDLCDGLECLKAGDKVLIKPNIVWGGLKSYPHLAGSQHLP
jgi:uncharacterized protein (DUF362 family)